MLSDGVLINVMLYLQDGKAARALGQSSTFGAVLDMVSDRQAEQSVVSALKCHLRDKNCTVSPCYCTRVRFVERPLDATTPWEY